MIDGKDENGNDKNFRPLSGSYISQFDEKCLIDGDENDFRPLSGSYISQYHQKNGGKQNEEISVPYRGATFLNKEITSYGSVRHK